MTKNGENPIHELEVVQAGLLSWVWLVSDVGKDLKDRLSDEELLMHEKPGKELNFGDYELFAYFFFFFNQSFEQIDACL